MSKIMVNSLDERSEHRLPSISPLSRKDCRFPDEFDIYQSISEKSHDESTPKAKSK